MTAGICSGAPGPAAGCWSWARCSQPNEPTSSSIWHVPPSKKNPRVPPATSTGVKALTTGMTAAAPGTSARRRLTVSIGNRPLTFGVTSTTPSSAAWASDGPNESNGRVSSNLSISVPSTTVTPSATPITLSSVRRQSPINAARWMRRKESHPPRSLRITLPPRARRRRRRTHARRQAQLAGSVACRGLVVCHHHDGRAVDV